MPYSKKSFSNWQTGKPVWRADEMKLPASFLGRQFPISIRTDPVKVPCLPSIPNEWSGVGTPGCSSSSAASYKSKTGPQLQRQRVLQGIVVEKLSLNGHGTFSNSIAFDLDYTGRANFEVSRAESNQEGVKTVSIPFCWKQALLWKVPFSIGNVTWIRL